MRKLAVWIIDNIKIGRLAPYIFGFAIGATDWKRTDNNRVNLTRKTTSGQVTRSGYISMETGKYKIYFRFWPFIYFLGKDTEFNRWVIMYKIWDEAWGSYRWKEITKK